MKKILFLDHDGVICLENNWGSRFKKQKTWRSTVDNSAVHLRDIPLSIRFDNFDIKAIRTLNSIIEATDCEIVVSSDWRFHASLEEMQELYLLSDILKSPIDFTPSLPSRGVSLEEERSNEILKWCELNKPEQFCAVDDLNMTQWLGDNFVLTPRSSEGIKQSGLKEKIIRKLNGANV